MTRLKNITHNLKCSSYTRKSMRRIRTITWLQKVEILAMLGVELIC